jgi:transketolase
LPRPTENLERLLRISEEIRRDILVLVHHAGTGHLGGPLSAVDILTVLYFSEMRVTPHRPRDHHRDRFVLSKGHSCPALYATLVERGFFPREELLTFDQPGSRLQGHPDMNLTPGVDISTGSLGQGLSAGIGFALAARLNRRRYRTYVLLGDGECQEGQVWEAAMLAARYGLSSLCAIVDCNSLQQYGWPTVDPSTRQVPVHRLASKWGSFGWSVLQVDGHDVWSIQVAMDSARKNTEEPTVILARTVKGKGASFMEGNYRWHAQLLGDEDFDQAMRELERGAGTAQER